MLHTPVAPRAVPQAAARARARAPSAAAAAPRHCAPHTCGVAPSPRLSAAPQRRHLRQRRTAAAASVPALTCPELAELASCTVYAAADGAPCPAAALVAPVGTTLVPFFTQFGDFDSFELAQRLVDALPALDAAGVRVAAVGVGSPEAARAFCRFTNFPVERLHADPTAACYDALRFAPGAGRPGGALPVLQQAPGAVKLLAMCAGLGSPGTLNEVFRGYLGDRNAPPVFNSGSNVDLPWKEAFNLVGSGYQRPFELATLRLLNMSTIIANWEALAPADADLLVQRGGVCVFRDGALAWRHNDAGILGYAAPAEVLRQVGVTSTAPQ